MKLNIKWNSNTLHFDQIPNENILWMNFFMKIYLLSTSNSNVDYIFRRIEKKVIYNFNTNLNYSIAWFNHWRSNQSHRCFAPTQCTVDRRNIVEMKEKAWLSAVIGLVSSIQLNITGTLHFTFPAMIQQLSDVHGLYMHSTPMCGETYSIDFNSWNIRQMESM